MRIAAFTGDAYHGFGNPDLWEKVCRDGLGLPPEPETDADFGVALYFTTSKKIATTYAQEFNRRPMIVKATINLERAVFLKFNGQRERWKSKKRTPSLQWIDRMVSRYGDPTVLEWIRIDERHTEPLLSKRLAVATRWREAMLKDGIDGIVADNYDSPRTIAVFDPKESIIDWICL